MRLDSDYDLGWIDHLDAAFKLRAWRLFERKVLAASRRYRISPSAVFPGERLRGFEALFWDASGRPWYQNRQRVQTALQQLGVDPEVIQLAALHKEHFPERQLDPDRVYAADRLVETQHLPAMEQERWARLWAFSLFEKLVTSGYRVELVGEPEVLLKVYLEAAPHQVRVDMEARQWQVQPPGDKPGYVLDLSPETVKDFLRYGQTIDRSAPQNWTRPQIQIPPRSPHFAPQSVGGSLCPSGASGSSPATE